MAGVLDGIRVVDLGHYVAGPLLAVMLADQGAEVIRIDRPGTRAGGEEPSYAFLHRGKRRITVDLKTAAGQEQALGLVCGADVLVENFRPGVLDRLGLGWDRIHPVAPRLVYCSLPGFGTDDPRAGVPGWEGVIAAATGNCRFRAGQAPAGWDTGRPIYAAVPMASNFAAFLGAFAVVTALTGRERSGQGQRIEIPLFDAVFESIGHAGAYVNRVGLAPQRPLGGNGSGTYRCADGRYVRFDPIGSSTRFLGWFLSAAGLAGWAAEVIAGVAAASIDWPERLRELFLTKPAQEWEDIGNAVGAPLCLIRTGEEWLSNEHARSAGQVLEVDDPLLGPTWMAGLPVRVVGHVHSPAARHLPDADHAELTAEATRPSADRSETQSSGSDQPPYDGVRVVDLTQILAGPSSTRLLGEFGADVIKINNPKHRVSAHGVVNRGKRSVLLNIESDQGRSVLWRLIDSADVFVQNFPEGTAIRYGLGYEHLRTRRPGIVYISVSCYGNVGPWSGRRGYETQGQATTGIMARAGGDHPPEVAGPYNIVDYGTGVLAGFAASLGVFHHARTGEGAHVQASLSQTGTLHQASYLLSPHAGPLPDWISGPQTLGLGACQRFYKCADGWLFLGARHDQTDLMAKIAGIDPAISSDDVLAASLEKALAPAEADESVNRLQEVGIGAHRVVDLAELMDDPWVRSRGLSVTQVSEEAGEVTMPGISIAMSVTPPKLGRACGRPGEDGAAVLSDVGLGDDVERLARDWVLQIDDLPLAWSRR